MKLWAGRFEKNTDKKVDDFNSSIRFDQRLYKQDIIGSIAHVSMLGKCGIIPENEAQIISEELRKILKEIEQGLIQFEIDAEDIHMNIEKILIQRLGDIGKKLHTGRSRNDQVALDIRMYIKEEIINIKKMLLNLLKCIVDIARNNIETIMPGYTHLQRAQPITFAHHLMAYFEMFKRDYSRLQDCYERTDVMPLGSGALAGTTYMLDRLYVKEMLNFSSISENSLDAVSDRDFIIELASSLAICMMHLSRFCEEIILWSTSEFAFIELDDSFTTGSSIMPQKKNPDVAELVRGKTGRVYGNVISLLTVMKALPLAYNKDMQEDKEAIFDSIDTVKMCLPVFTEMLYTLKVNKNNMAAAARGGFTNATDLADYLVKKGVPFRNAHEITGKIVLYCIDINKPIEELSLQEMKNFCSLIEEDVYTYIDILKCVKERKIPGGPAPEAVLSHIEKASAFINKETLI